MRTHCAHCMRPLTFGTLNAVAGSTKIGVCFDCAACAGLTQLQYIEDIGVTHIDALAEIIPDMAVFLVPIETEGK